MPIVEIITEEGNKVRALAYDGMAVFGSAAVALSRELEPSTAPQPAEGGRVVDYARPETVPISQFVIDLAVQELAGDTQD